MARLIRSADVNADEISDISVNAPSMFRATPSIFLFIAGPTECSVIKIRIVREQSSLIVKLFNSYNIGILQLGSERAAVAQLLASRKTLISRRYNRR